MSTKKALKTHYPGIDDLQNATIQDKYIYITTYDTQHARIAAGQVLDVESRTALSGYFTNESTIRRRLNADGTFDAYGLARDTCIEPFSKTGQTADACDKAHLDRFYIDRDRLEELYGTRDFNAAIGKCSANNQYGSDGGDQGYNQALNELYNNGCLKYDGTYNAAHKSVTKCRDEYEQMNKSRLQKCSAQISGRGIEDVQKIGYPLDARCHEKTQFDVKKTYKNQEDLSKAYQGEHLKYNEQKASTTAPGDRMTVNVQDNQHSGTYPHEIPQKASAPNLNDKIAEAAKKSAKSAQEAPEALGKVVKTPSGISM